jgi:hypothetical protein
MDNAELLSLLKKSRLTRVPKEALDEIVKILSGRGLDQDVLRRIGHLSADPFDEALKHYEAFKRCSKWVFICYLVFIGSILVSFLLEPSPAMSVCLILIFCTLVTLVMGSLVQQSRFYRAIGSQQSGGSPLVFFFLGMPLYFLMFLSYRQKMEARLEELV